MKSSLTCPLDGERAESPTATSVAVVPAPGLAAADEQANGSVVRRYLRGLHILVDFADDPVRAGPAGRWGLPVACGAVQSAR